MMKLTRKTIELVCKLERIIGDECYNPNSYDGYLMEYGKYFRYPVHYVNREKGYCRTNGTVQNIDKEGVKSMHYCFGSNELNIGSALVKVLECLEEKYGLDFNQLAKNKKL